MKKKDVDQYLQITSHLLAFFVLTAILAFAARTKRNVIIMRF